MNDSDSLRVLADLVEAIDENDGVEVAHAAPTEQPGPGIPPQMAPMLDVETKDMAVIVVDLDPGVALDADPTDLGENSTEAMIDAMSFA